MNLTNDNVDGCQQIAAAGGLQSVASLLVARCPLPQSNASGHEKRSPSSKGPGQRDRPAGNGVSVRDPPKVGVGKAQGKERETEHRPGEREENGHGGRVRRVRKGLDGIGDSLETEQPEEGPGGTAPPSDDVMDDADVSKERALVAVSKSAEVWEGPSEDLDLVTVVLALLVNLVEKDRGNRAALAALDFPVERALPGKPLEGRERAGLVAFLCALFLSKKGAGAKAESAENEAAAFEVRGFEPAQGSQTAAFRSEFEPSRSCFQQKPLCFLHAAPMQSFKNRHLKRHEGVANLPLSRFI